MQGRISFKLDDGVTDVDIVESAPYNFSVIAGFVFLLIKKLQSYIIASISVLFALCSSKYCFDRKAVGREKSIDSIDRFDLLWEGCVSDGMAFLLLFCFYLT